MSIRDTIKAAVDEGRSVLNTTEGRVATGVVAGLIAIYAAYKFINRNK